MNQYAWAIDADSLSAARATARLHRDRRFVLVVLKIARDDVLIDMDPLDEAFPNFSDRHFILQV